MAIPVLNELSNELTRIYVAGSPLAKGDPRLSKYIPVLKKLGEKAAVFNSLSERIDALVNGSSDDSAVSAMEASLLLYSLHYTQGSASADGEVKTPAYNSHAVSTYNIPYSQLSETIEMLSKDSKEHSAIPETLYESGLYKDPRLFPYFVKAISDSHSVISDYVEENIIPALGDVIIPYLEDVLDIQGSKRHGRIFRLLHQLKGKDIIPLAQRAAAEGSPHVASAAIAALGEDAKFEELLLVYAKDKKAEVRGAAFTALLNLDSPKGVEMLTAELGKNSISHIELAASSSKNKAVFQKVVEETENVFTDSEKNHNKIAVLLRILARSDENTALELIENKVISVLKSKGANWTVTAFELNNLFNILLERERKYLEAAYRILSVADDKYFMPYIKMRLAVKLFSAEKVFDECKDSNYYYLLYEVYGVQKGEHIPDEQKSWDRRWGKRLAEKNTFFHEFIYDSDDKAWDIFLVRVKTQVQRNTPPLINAYPHPGELYKWLCVNKHPKAEIFYKILLKLGFTESEIRECLLK